GNFAKVIHQATNGNWTRAFGYDEASGIDPGSNSNRLSNTAVGSTKEPYLYDAHGNLTGIPHLALMQWDFRNQLSATSRQAVGGTAPAGLPDLTRYAYDSGGQRVRKIGTRANGV